VDVIANDWDNLLILDACRFDAFRSECSIAGELSYVASQATSSWEFIRENFTDKRLHDTVYITANPYVSKLPDNTFFRVYPLFQTEWDENARTVLPGAVADMTRTVIDKHPDKRLIAHFMQPHTPYVGELGDKIPHRADTRTTDRVKRSPEETRDIWTNLQYGLEDVDVETVWRAYIESLRIVLDEAEELIEDITGKTVITSDHGELFGERLSPIPVRGYGHSSDIHISALKKVPWFETEAETRREVTDGKPEDFHTDEDVVDKRLVDLGYK